MPLPVYEGGHIAREIVPYEFSIDTQIQIEQEIIQALEAMPSMYSDKVSRRAFDAWEERFFKNVEMHRHFRIRDQAEIASERPGRKLHTVQFVRALNTLPRRRWCLNSWSVRGMRGLSVSRGGGKPEYIMAIDDGPMPEWSKIELDDHGLVKHLEARGWRAVLLTLFDKHLITEAEARTLFGFPSGISGGLYRKYLFEHRNRKFADSEQWLEENRLRPNERYPIE
jgi:hypothetical protein